MNIVLDGMGGDNAPQAIVRGAVAATAITDADITIVGPEALIRTCLEGEGYSGSQIHIVNATEVVTNNEAPAMAVKKKKDSTVVRGIMMLKDGEGDAFISGGSTGALLAASLFNLGRIKGVKRPGIATFFPKVGKNEKQLILDVGASVDPKPEYLLQYGLMGTIFMQCVKGIENPTVMLLNVGSEEEKGDDVRKEAFKMLSDSSVNFKGNIEGRDVPEGICDVVVTDGFSGNIFLKTSEGIAIAVMNRIKDKIMESTVSKIGGLLAKKKLYELKGEFDYSEEGGAPILGVKGAVLKIHGSSEADAVKNAIIKAIDYVESDVTGKIAEAILESNELQKEKSAAEAEK